MTYFLHLFKKIVDFQPQLYFLVTNWNIKAKFYEKILQLFILKTIAKESHFSNFENKIFR